MIPEGPNPISTYLSLHTTARSQREPESPTPIHCLEFPALTPFLSCTLEDFIIVLSQEGTLEFDPLLRQKGQPHLGVSLPKQPHRKQSGLEPKEVKFEKLVHSTPGACPRGQMPNSEVNRRHLASKETSRRQLGVGHSLWGGLCEERWLPYSVSRQSLKISALWQRTYTWEGSAAVVSSFHHISSL